MGKQPTKKQHIIPQMMLKKIGFFNIPMLEPLLYQLDIHSKVERISRTTEICKKKNIYEIRDETGSIIESERNMIEKHLGRLEALWNPLINKMVKCEKASENDTALLYILMAMQLLRTPEIIEMMRNIIINNFPSLNKYEADRYAKISSLMFGGIKLEATWMSSILIENFVKKQVVILHSTIPFIIGQQRPVLFLKDADVFFLPIEKNTCLCLRNTDFAENIIHESVDEAFVRFINKNTLANIGRLFYCSESMLNYLNG